MNAGTGLPIDHDAGERPVIPALPPEEAIVAGWLEARHEIAQHLRSIDGSVDRHVRRATSTGSVRDGIEGLVAVRAAVRDLIARLESPHG